MTEWSRSETFVRNTIPSRQSEPFGSLRVGKLSEELKPGWWMAKHPVTGTDAAFIRAHIVDTAAVRKFKANIFTGFSVGGQINPGGFKTEEIKVNVVKKTVRRLTDFSFAEISAVDKPACDLALVDSVLIAKRRADEPTTIRTIEDVERYVKSIVERSRREHGVPQSEVNKVLQKIDTERATRRQTPPTGTSNAAIAAARMREDWPKIGEHLRCCDTRESEKQRNC